MINRMIAVLSSVVVFVVVGGCETTSTPTARVTSGGEQTIAQAQAEAYNGPKARIAVSQFSDKTGKGWWTGGIGDGMRDMLATALFNTNRYIVLERQTLQDVLTEQDLGASGRVRQETAAPIGEIEGAELLVTGAVTEFEPGSSGIGGGIGGGSWGSVVGGVLGGIQRSHVAIDLRVVDTKTSRIVAATSVAGEATDFNLGGVLVGSHVGGGLGGYSKTPMEKAVRVALSEAVNFVVSKTPATYYHYSATGTPVSQTSAPAPTAPPAGAGYEAFFQSRILYVTGNTANIRADAGKGFGVVGSVKKGDALIGLGKKGDWYHVRMSNGQEGYVFQNLVSTNQ